MSDPDFTSAVAFSEKAARKVGELILRQGRTNRSFGSTSKAAAARGSSTDSTLKTPRATTTS